jgi:hypothetical protein
MENDTLWYPWETSTGLNSEVKLLKDFVNNHFHMSAFKNKKDYDTLYTEHLFSGLLLRGMSKWAIWDITVHICRPGHSQQNVWWSWSSPLTEIKIVGRVWVITGP